MLPTTVNSGISNPGAYPATQATTRAPYVPLLEITTWLVPAVISVSEKAVDSNPTWGENMLRIFYFALKVPVF